MQAPKGKHLFGTVKVGEKGQIVIPKDAREIFNIKPGDSLIVLGDEASGLAIMKNDVFMAQVAGAIFQNKPAVEQGAPSAEPPIMSFVEIQKLAEKHAED